MEDPAYQIEHLLAHDAHVRALARRLIRDPDAAEDVAQETWVAALRGKPSPHRVRAWFRATVRNLASKQDRSRRRRQAREQRAAKPEAEPSVVEIVARESQRQSLVRAVLSLDEPYRSTILLRYFDDVSIAEIARRDGVAPSAIEKRITRAFTGLRVRLTREFGGERSCSAALAAVAGVKASTLPAASVNLVGAFMMGKVATVGVSIALLVGLGFVMWPAANPTPPPVATWRTGPDEEHRESAARDAGVPASQAVDPGVSMKATAPRVVSVNVVVTDALTEQALAGVGVAFDASDWALTDENGRASQTALSSGQRQLRLRLPAALGNREYSRTIEVVEGGDVVKVRLPGYSGVRVRFNHAQGTVQGVVFVRAYPPIPDTVEKASLTYKILESARQEPGTYLRRLDRMCGRDASGVIGRRVIGGARVAIDASPDVAVGREVVVQQGSSIDFYVPWGGQVVVQAKASVLETNAPIVSEPVLADLRPGEFVDVRLPAERKPRISGVVCDQHGVPMPNVPVTVACRVRFAADAPRPNARSDSAGTGFIVVQHHGSPYCVVVAQRTCKTDKEGRFALAMPFSNEVAAWVHVRGFREGYTERYDTVDRFSDVADMRLVLKPQILPEPTITVVDQDGQVVPGVTLGFIQVDPRHAFQKKWPRFTTAEDGTVGIPWLKAGAAYCVFPKSPRSRFKPVRRFIAGHGELLRLTRIEDGGDSGAGIRPSRRER